MSPTLAQHHDDDEDYEEDIEYHDVGDFVIKGKIFSTTLHNKKKKVNISERFKHIS